MKKISIAFILILILLVSVLSLVFFKPLLILNPKTLKFVLNRTHVLESWSWKSARFGHEWKAWNRREFSGEFSDFCFTKASDSYRIQTCLEKVSWNFDLKFDFKKGLHSTSIDPIIIRSSFTNATFMTGETPPPPGPPLDLRKYWKIFWSEIVPDMDLLFQKISIKHEGKPTVFDFSLVKDHISFNAKALNFVLEGNKNEMNLRAPPRYPIKSHFGTRKPLVFKDMVLNAKITKTGVPLRLTGALETIDFTVDSHIHLPLKGEFSSLAFRKDFFINTKAEIKLLSLKKSLKAHAPHPFYKLPSPLNPLDGSIIFKGQVGEGKSPEEIFISSQTTIDLKSLTQVVSMSLDLAIPLNVMTFSPGNIVLGINFYKVILELPRLSKKSLPPQFFPDKRFRSGPIEKPKEGNDVMMNFEAENSHALVLKTNLIDEDVRLNFDLLVKDNAIQKGFVRVLPLQTKVFKRTVQIKDLIIKFRKAVDPVLKAKIMLPLPEYTVTLFMEGPISKPRFAFVSNPPLSRNDIYAVLLLGRPLEQLDPDDKSAVQRTNQVLSQGILTISTLYFLSGGPVEYIGYDPDSNSATAQFGLGDKSSLRVGGGRDGINSTSIRRSLGKGWFIDTSVQDSAQTQQSKEKNYGVLLERIISY